MQQDGDVERVRFTFMGEERGGDGKRLGREGKVPWAFETWKSRQGSGERHIT